MTAAELVAVLTAAAGLVTAVAALVHSIRTRAAAVGQARSVPRGSRSN